MPQQNEISFFAKTNFRNQERIFGIKTDDRRRHMYVIGKTGMGKTNLLENLAIQDIKHGKGVAFIDPHGDTAEKLIKAIPAERINDVIYFNPADQEYPIAFNVMEKVDPEYQHLVASGLVGVFKKLWADSWGPRLEYILRNAILALLEYPGSTLLGVTRILVDKDYRERVVAKVSDPVVRAFWVDEFSKWNDRVLQEVISPIQNKVGQFLSTSLIRNIVGQTVSSFDVREVMDNRKILIMNLSKGRIGEDASALIGAMMITKIQLAAMERVDMPEDDRNDFYLYVDEFQNFATESFANILSEARKYHLNLILANQYIAQLDEKVSDAIFGNAGTIISFRVGAADAEVLEKEFEPVFMMNDIVNLPKYNIYLKLMIDGIAGDAFSATVLPPISLEETRENEEKVVRISRERYASSKKEVEDKIRRWSGMLTEEERNELLRKKGLLPSEQVSAPVSPSPVSAPVVSAPARVAPVMSSAPVAMPEPPLSPMSSSVVVSDDDGRRDAVEKVSPEEPIQVTESVPLHRRQPVVVPDEDEELLLAAATKPVKPPKPSFEDRPMYPAICDSCGSEIRVPFQPDGKRPTYCKECFKNHQRTLVKAKPEERPQGGQRPTMSASRPVAPRRPAPPVRPMAPAGTRSYVSAEAPISLSRAALVAPKKFRPLRERSAPDLGAVRDLLGSTRQDRPSRGDASSET
ncbi:MAG: type IV secretion system DNA-binding domain-containing protein [Candidatus Moranbacteria bacterium]|nr:type IV secretion system DNA-binding domain-containing protein [Candidatus Moranbacteria bacterium]NTW45619.1 type IV secretion system DNA-binding domain-containing protein [Candidatus Moranbacteria bacterium]